MSTEARLGRLGLLHLIDKPEELQKELQKRHEKNMEISRLAHEESKARQEYLDAHPEVRESLPKVF